MGRRNKITKGTSKRNAKKGIWKSIGFSKEQISSEKNPVGDNSLPTEKYTEEEKEIIKNIEEAMEIADNSVTKKITHKGFAKDSIIQQYVQYAYEIWGIDLVTLIDCENGTWDMYRQSSVVKNWKRERSFWFCQISQVYHPEIVNTDEFWNNWKWQLDRCRELMNWWTAFYGRDRKIKGVKCSKYVLDRFIITDGNNNS